MTSSVSFTSKRPASSSSSNAKSRKGVESSNEKSSSGAPGASNQSCGNGQSSQNPATEAESDVDELVDSDTEKTASQGQSKGSKPSKIKSATRRNPSGSKTKAQISADDSNQVEGQLKPNVDARYEQHGYVDHPNPSRESLGRTATGGALPYYYAQPNPSSFAAAPKAMEGKAGPTHATALGAESGDLTLLEVDKFLDLIEKYNLDTSNEHDMAHSVTELYQEWLEWCAKRNVQSTKSKQALVSEFVRIHSGAYGSARQQRATSVVQGQGGRPFDHFGMTRAAIDPPGHLNRQAPHAAKAADVIGATSNRAAASPALIARPLTPGSTYKDVPPNGKDVLPPMVLERLHRQIRNEIWQEASAMINQILHEQMSQINGQNRAMASRIEQLEIHSDNLAQWIHHLNRMYDEMLSGSGPLRGSTLRQGPISEELHAAEKVHRRQAIEQQAYGRHPEHMREYRPPGFPVIPLDNSPRRIYSGPVGSRRSPPPPREDYDYRGAPLGGGPHIAPMVPSHRSGQDLSYNASSPHPRNAAPTGGGSVPSGVAYYDDHARSGPLPPSEAMYGDQGMPAANGSMPPRGYYMPRHSDERVVLTSRLPGTSPQPAPRNLPPDARQTKRARNGY